MSFILLAEDQSDVREAIACMLRADGHNVTEARDGHEALRLLVSHRPEIVLTDIVMPTTDGIEVIVANHALSRPAKLIAMTGARGLGSMDYLEVAEALGADATLRKPFRLAELRAAIRICQADDDSPAVKARVTRQKVQAIEQPLDERPLLRRINR